MFEPKKIIEQYQISEVAVAKVRAWAKAYKSLDIITPVGEPEKHFTLNIDGYPLEGYLDLYAPPIIYEDKTSGRPDFYTGIWGNDFQDMTYLLGFPEADRVVRRVVRVPGTKYRTKDYSNETPEQYGERVYKDIMSRPAYYFQGFRRKERTYGMTFWRSEYNLDAHYETLSRMIANLRHIIDTDGWYANGLACLVPTPCSYLDIKKTGVISEVLYKQLTPNDVKGGMR